ncbi:TonB-dependent receptor [Pedobacter endophyticus]|uniref:TonB-dependent receptor n=1 Tax=Pedobacter endophyticus TaxID=2789740 RepID=A0A7S9PYY7_9SPHI|nr:TonB-dependent receptor [Pedobacter endophyticus]QPH39963.1 TonB-dependent receptor [Pedobacter endophyticus]
MRRSFTFLLLLFTIKAFAQTGSIKGTVTTADGKPAELVSIKFREIKRTSVADENGAFTFHKVPVGTYTLVASYTGLNPQQQQVTIIANSETAVNFILTENREQLNEVFVQGNSNKFANKNTEHVARMPLKNLENPQVYSVVGEKLLKEQVVTTMLDALKMAPGVAPTSFPSGGVGLVSRGFITSIGARNGLQSNLGRSSADVSNIERIEFIKGPSGVLFGSGISSFGGVVNLVTKKPIENFFGNVGLTVGSFGLARITADVNAPVNQDKTLLARVNTALHRQNSFSDFGRTNSFAFAPSLLYKASNKLTFLFDAEIFNATSSRPTYTIINPKSGYTNFKDLPLPYRTSLYDNDVDAKTESQKYFVEAKYQINDHWTSSSNLSYVNEFTEYSYQTYNTWTAKNTVARYIGIWGPIKNTYINAQQNFVGKFKTGPIKHTLLTGLNYTNLYANGSSKRAPNFDTVNVTMPNKLINKIQANDILLKPSAVINWRNTKNELMGAYVSEVLNVEDRLYAMLSLRFDRYTSKQTGQDDYQQNALAPKLGLVYQLIKNQVSVFGNYMSGFQNNNPIQEQPDGSILSVKPIFANQWEAGVKSEIFNGKVSSTLSYYSINIDNALRRSDGNFISQDGQQQSKGFEFEFLANPIASLNIILGYGYNENKIVKAAANEGNFVAGAPNHIANYWLSYQFASGALKNVGAGFGGNYVGKSYFNDSNSITLPQYHVVNAALFYNDLKWRLGLKMNNIGNAHYWDYFGIYNPTRNFAVDFTLKF